VLSTSKQNVTRKYNTFQPDYPYVCATFKMASVSDFSDFFALIMARCRLGTSCEI